MTTQEKTCLHVALVLGLLGVALRASPASADSAQVERVRQAMQRKHATWTAAENAISRLPPEARRSLLLRQAPTRTDRPQVTLPTKPPTFPASFDWRNVGGRSYVTPVRSQVGNTCVAYAGTAAMESAVLRKSSLQCTDIDLSEHALVSCNAGYPGDVATFLTNVGLPSDACYPFASASAQCNTACAGWKSRTYRAVNHEYFTGQSLETTKVLLVAYGPVVTGMNVATDFFYYKGGVYSNALEIDGVTVENCVAAAKLYGFAYAGLQDGEQCFVGNKLANQKVSDAECSVACAANPKQKCGGPWRNSVYATSDSAYQGCYTDDASRALPTQLNGVVGLHEVLIVGYDDASSCFIAKNSWGTDWGEAGYFRISYGEFGHTAVGFGGAADIYPTVTGAKCVPNDLCDANTDCTSGQVCKSGKCTAP